MKVIGITGGVGCGKSTVLELIKDNFNSYIVKADDVGHHVLDKKEKGYSKVLEYFGTGITCGNGEIDRNKLAQIVFNNSDKLKILNSIVHPLVKAAIVDKMNFLRCQGKYDYFFIEAALLFEDNYEILCDEVWYIYADYDIRVKRLIESRGYSIEKINSIIKNQMSEDEFRDRCDYVLDNSKGLEETLLQLKKKLVEE